MEESIFLVQPGIYKSQGRNSITVNGLALDCTGSTFEFAAFCRGDVTLGIYVDAPEAYENRLYFSVYIDGQLLEPREKFGFGGKRKTELVLARDLEEGYHTFSVIRQNESETGEFCIRYIILTGRLQTPPRDRDRYIEFVGDSITTGIGNLYTPDSWDPNVDPKKQGLPGRHADLCNPCSAPSPRRLQRGRTAGNRHHLRLAAAYHAGNV